MPRKKSELITVKITYPVWIDDRQFLPVETATVPAAIAAEWIQNEQATAVVAEEKWQPEEV